MTTAPLCASTARPGRPGQEGSATLIQCTRAFATTHTNALPCMAEKVPCYENRHLHEFCQVGGYIVFPNGLEPTRPTKVRPRRWTLNQAKGCDRRISDRFDLTLEAIRLFFDGKTSRDVNPLGDVLDAYGWFFAPFGAGDEGFRAYVDCFLLAPMVSGGRVRLTTTSTVRMQARCRFGLRRPYLIECSGNPPSPGQRAACGSRAYRRRASSHQVRVESRKAIGMPRRGSPRVDQVPDPRTRRHVNPLRGMPRRM